MFGEMKSLAMSFFKMAHNVKSISELRLCAKIFSEQFINAVLYDVAIK